MADTSLQAGLRQRNPVPPPTATTTTTATRTAASTPPARAAPAPPNPFSLLSILGFNRVTPTLPASVSQADRDARQQELDANRALYIYQSPPTIPGVAFIQGPVDALPHEIPSRAWVLRAGLAGARVVFNFSENPIVGFFKAIAVFIRAIFVDRSNEAALVNARSTYNAGADTEKAERTVMRRFEKANEAGSQFEERNPILAPYRALYNILPYPKIADIFLEDDVFERMRVAGFNPMSLFRVRDATATPFPVTDEDLPHQGDTLAAAVAENRLYGVDYSFLAKVKQTNTDGKFAVVTKGLFVVPPGGGLLQSVAIEMAGRIVRPTRLGQEDDSTTWAIAKMALTVCDSIHHELIAHLGRTHLLVEPFVAATMRQLPSKHPVHVLMRPHFEGTVFINDTASKALVAPGGDVDRIFAGDIASVMAWCAQVVIKNPFNSSMPDVEMEARGLMDPVLYMPYREDALEHFKVMNEWVYDFLSHYYKSDADVVGDEELQMWVEELMDPARGRLREFGDKGDGKVLTVRYLARAVAFVIFSGSVQHAAVNFPQYDYMSYPPCAPAALWASLPDHDKHADLNKWAAMLTPMKTAVEQVQILGVIGTLRHTQLGNYRPGQLPGDKAISTALAAYKSKLGKIDARIEARERDERLPYTFMRPKNVPQSINI